MSTPSRVALGAASLLLASLFAPVALAQQAWVGERSSLSASLDYAYSRSNIVLEEWPLNHDEIDPIFSHTTTLGVEYVPIDKLGVIATIPLIATMYDAESAVSSLPPHGRYDSGGYHLTLQDFRLDVRYMALDDIVTISPHIAVSVPMTNYETVGYANAGRGLKQLIFGFAVGKFFTSGVPNLYLHGRYEFRLTEGYETPFAMTEEFGQNRSFMDGFIGYYILDELEVNLGGSVQIAHGGFKFIDWNPDDTGQLPAQYFHDPLLAEQFFHLGGGLSYQPIEGMRVSAFVRFFVWGENTRNADIYGTGISWDFM